MERRRKRGENWTTAEKDLLRELVAPSHEIIEHKSNATTIVMLKHKEWKSIMTRFNKITGKNRSAAEVRFAWKRLKLATKLNIKTEQEDFPTEDAGPIVRNKNNSHFSGSDFSIVNSDYRYDEDASQRGNIEVIVERNLSDEETVTHPVHLKKEPNTGNGSYNDISEVLDVNYKKRRLEILEEEHRYNIKIAQLRIQKLEVEIALLESNRDGQSSI